MIPLNLNLLPPAKKDKLEKTVRFLFIKRILETIIIVYSVLAIVFIGGWLVIQDEFAYLSSSAFSVNREYSAYNNEIREVNKIINTVSRFSKGYAKLLPYLVEITTSMPSDIKFSSVSIDRSTQTLSLSGTAKTRNSLLNFKEQMKTIPWLAIRETPLSTLLQREDINFEFTAEIQNLPMIK